MGSGRPEVTETPVDLWVADPTAAARPDRVAQILGWLSAAERARYDAFYSEVHRREYLVTRALALHVLAAYAGVDPTDLRFERNAHGCPRLVSHPFLHFNLTHATSMVALLVSGRGVVGVDLEPIAHADRALEVAELVFAKVEIEAMRALPTLEARRRRALDLWTLKEAYIKARGKGLAIPLEGFAFDVDGASPRVTVDPSLGDDGARWTFSGRDLDGHRVATCVEVAGRAAAPEVRVRRFLPLADPPPRPGGPLTLGVIPSG